VPQTVKGNGATIIEINPEESNFTNRLTDIYLQGKAGEVLTDLKRFLFKILVIAYDWNYNFKYSNNKGLF
jgi:NAD-dependent SIR2 family protein deacetylase